MEANYVFLLGAFLPHLLSLGKDIVHDFGCGVTLTPLEITHRIDEHMTNW